MQKTPSVFRRKYRKVVRITAGLMSKNDDPGDDVGDDESGGDGGKLD
jgi:hypothetical protein